MSKQRSLSQDQVLEWAENPVTLALLELICDEIDRIEATPVINCLAPGEPQKTQDNLIDLTARAYTWDTIREVLEGDWSYLTEEDDDESSSESGY